MFNILIIEDNPSDSKILSALLNKMNYHSFEADGWFKAQQILQAYPVHLILLDWQLPQYNGIDILKTLKNDKKTKNIPVIFVTSRNEVKSVQKALQEGAADYVLKPIDVMILKNKITKFLNQQSEEWRLTVLPEDIGQLAQPIFNLKVKKISEVGLEIESPVAWPLGMPLELRVSFLTAAGISSIVTKIQSCEKNGDVYICRCSLVGMKESDLQKIRLTLRALQIGAVA